MSLRTLGERVEWRVRMREATTKHVYTCAYVYARHRVLRDDEPEQQYQSIEHRSA